MPARRSTDDGTRFTRARTGTATNAVLTNNPLSRPNSAQSFALGKASDRVLTNVTIAGAAQGNDRLLRDASNERSRRR